MNPPPGPLRALAATARVANLPSVVSNTWLGILLAGGPASGIHAVALSVSAVSLYLCGTFINDWTDRRWDATHRPERALPRQLFPAALYSGIAMLMAALAMTGAALVSPHAMAVTAAILMCIGIYTWLHKKSAWAVLSMGLCRGLLPLLGLAAGDDTPTAIASALPVAVLAGAGLFLHVASISWLARGESRPESSSRNEQKSASKPPLAGFAACAVLIAGGAFLILGLPAAACIAGVLPYVLWTATAWFNRRISVAGRVSALLAGIPLVDWALLLPVYLTDTSRTGSPLGWDCTSTLCLWLPPGAFILGRFLQRLSPAT